MAACKIVIRDSRGEISRVIETDTGDPLAIRIAELEKEAGDLRAKLDDSEQLRVREVAQTAAQNDPLLAEIRQLQAEKIGTEMEITQFREAFARWRLNDTILIHEVNLGIARLREKLHTAERQLAAEADRASHLEHALIAAERQASQVESHLADLTMPANPYPPRRRKRRLSEAQLYGAVYRKVNAGAPA